jgi:hypothetical protein
MFLIHTLIKIFFFFPEKEVQQELKVERNYLNSFSFGSAVLGNSSGVFLHGRGRGHAVEQLPLLPVALNDLATGLKKN